MAGEQAPEAEPLQHEPAVPEQPESESSAEQGAEESPSEGDDTASLRREAAGYRRKLREAEGQAEHLAEQLAGLQRKAIEAQVAGPGKLAVAPIYGLRA